MKNNITALVFALNEERRIPYIYQNLRDFCEIIVFDGGSIDGTETYCKNNGIKFIKRPEDNSEMRLQTLAWVYKQTQTEYVLHVYGAHFFPGQLLRKFAAVANEGKKLAVFHDVVIYRYGSVVHRPLFRRISAGCNFYQKSIIDFNKSKIHDELAITFDSETMIRLSARDELALHLFQDEDCESYTKKTINYQVIEARQRFAAGQTMNSIKLVFAPLGRFIYNYLRTGIFAKGEKGLAYALLNMIYDYNVSIILWEIQTRSTLEEAVKKNASRREQLLKGIF